MRIAMAEAPPPTCWWHARGDGRTDLRLIWHRLRHAEVRQPRASGVGYQGRFPRNRKKKGESLKHLAVAVSDSPRSPGSLHRTRPERYGVLLSLNENCRGERSSLVVYLLLWALRSIVANVIIYTNHVKHASGYNGWYQRVGGEAHLWNYLG
jgi:hypothetical protein